MEFEEGKTVDAKFVKAMDRLEPLPKMHQIVVELGPNKCTVSKVYEKKKIIKTVLILYGSMLKKLLISVLQRGY